MTLQCKCCGAWNGEPHKEGCEVAERYIRAVSAAKEKLRPGDRVFCTKCMNRKYRFIFDHWDGIWMVSRTGINDFHPINVYRVNAEYVDFGKAPNDKITSGSNAPSGEAPSLGADQDFEQMQNEMHDGLPEQSSPGVRNFVNETHKDCHP